MAAMVQQVCWCGKKFEARAADVNRGWGKSCCKKHAARARERKLNAIAQCDGYKMSHKEPDYMLQARTIDEGMLGMDFDWSPI